MARISSRGPQPMFSGDGDGNDSPMAGGWHPEVDNGYAPSDFIIPGTDHQGHSERLYFRVQPQHARAGSKILAQKKFPFRTMGDLMRWSYVRGLKVLEKLDPMPGFMGAADAINEVLRQEMYMQEFKSMFNTMQSVVQSHLQNGAKGEARRLLSVCLFHIRKIDEPFWRKKCEDDLKQRFAHLLEGGDGKVSLRVKGDGEEEE